MYNFQPLKPKSLEPPVIACHFSYDNAAVRYALRYLSERETRPVIAVADISKGDFTANTALPENVTLLKISGADLTAMTGAPRGVSEETLFDHYPDFLFLHPAFERYESVFHLFYDICPQTSISETIDKLIDNNLHASVFAKRHLIGDLRDFGQEYSDYRLFYLLAYGLENRMLDKLYPCIAAGTGLVYLSEPAAQALRSEREEQIFLSRQENIDRLPASELFIASALARLIPNAAFTDLSGYFGEEIYDLNRYIPPHLSSVSALRQSYEDKIFTILTEKEKARATILRKTEAVNEASNALLKETTVKPKKRSGSRQAINRP